MKPITARERIAIKRLQDALQQMPNTLWLFTNGEGLNVLKYKQGRQRALKEHGGMDGDYIVANIQPSCEIDGGDW